MVIVMEMKKTWLSYLLWFVYAGLAGVLLAFCLSAWCIHIWGLDKLQTVAAVCVTFAGVAGVWFGGRSLTVFLAGRFSEDAHLANMWECFLALCIYVIAVLYRIFLILREYQLSYESVDGLWTLLVQALTLPVFFFAVRLLVGRIEAVCGAAVLALSPLYAQAVLGYSPESGYFLCFSQALLLLGFYAGGSGEKKGRPGAYLFLALIGGYIGVLGYYSLSGWTLLFLLFFLCAGEVARRQVRISGFAVKLCLAIIAALFGMAVPALGDAMMTGRPVWDLFGAWWEANHLLPAGVGFPMGPGGALAADTVILFLGALAAVGFWFHTEQKQDGWILLLVALTWFQMTDMGAFGPEILLVAVWSVFAGLGVASMRRVRAEAPEAAPMEGQPKEEPILIEDLNIEEIVEGDEAEPPVKLIENPLPLPKKHVKRTMDYEREPGEGEMVYDYFVADEDDFDI